MTTRRLLSINSYHYRRGGADAVYLDHAALMESLGWKNAFFAMHYPQNDPTEWSRYFIDEIQFGHDYSLGQKIVKASKVIYSFEAQRKLRHLIADFQPDIAHIHNIYHHQSPSILPVLKRAGIPSVMTAHDLKIACPNNKMLNRTGICERCKGGRFHEVIRYRCVQDSLAASTIVAAESTLHRWLDSYARNLDRIIVPSRFYLEKFVQWGWRRDLFAYVPNYVDASGFAPAYRPGDYFLFFGRLAEEKGVATLVEAAARSGVRLKLAGTGPLDTDLKAIAARSGADIEFLGFRTGPGLHALVGGSRAVVLPSEWYENAPISVLEAFALGKPVIGADIGGIPELVRPGETGWLFKSGDVDGLSAALQTVRGLPDAEIEGLGRQARTLVAHDFSRRRYVESILEIYSALGVRIAQPAAVQPSAT